MKNSKKLPGKENRTLQPKRDNTLEGENCVKSYKLTTENQWMWQNEVRKNESREAEGLGRSESRAHFKFSNSEHIVTYHK